MPRFNVHIYTPYRVKFADIVAGSAKEAAEIAYRKPHDEAVEIADAEGVPTDALVDELEIGEDGQPTGEIVGDDGVNLDFKPRRDGTAEAVPSEFPISAVQNLSDIRTAAAAALDYLDDDCEAHWSPEQRAAVESLRAALGPKPTTREV